MTKAQWIKNQIKSNKRLWAKQGFNAKYVVILYRCLTNVSISYIFLYQAIVSVKL